ncbi:MAG: hypothetical protein AB7F75_02405 [Planctomycetota bacterium]
MASITVTPGSLTCRLRNSDTSLGDVVSFDDTGFTVMGQLPPSQAPYLELSLHAGANLQPVFSYVTRTPKGLRGRWVPLDSSERIALESFLGSACGHAVTLRIPEPTAPLQAPALPKAQPPQEDALPPLDPKIETMLRELLGDVMTKVSEADLRILAQRILQAEQGKGETANDRELLERKVSRLAKALEEMERKYQESLRLAGEPGAVPLGPIVTGLNEVDPNRDRKKALLKEIFEQNRVVRELLK